jgi:hypothetical protein
LHSFAGYSAKYFPSGIFRQVFSSLPGVTVNPSPGSKKARADRPGLLKRHAGLDQAAGL